MGNFIEAGKTTDYQNGTKKKVQVQGQEILLARIDDNYYGVSNRCPHLGGDLSAGRLEGKVITCPRHKSQFDITNGSVVRWMKGAGLLAAVGKALKSPRPLTTYNVKIEGDTILVEI